MENSVIEPRVIETTWKTDVVYHEYTCSECSELARNTYSEPSRTHMLERRLCWDCNYWRDFEVRLANDHRTMTIINGHVYGPGNRTSGSMRGMAGRRFDIEFVEPSIHAGKRVTTFDLWSGSTLPDRLKEKFPDTAKFLGGAERCQVGETMCWNPSDRQEEPYPLPRTLGIL
ncbi:hypothetical protein G6K93_07495 [Agrobacterium rhizogenes]|nr:hypothetical protein [Rhizobium rhizogenes]